MIPPDIKEPVLLAEPAIFWRPIEGQGGLRILPKINGNMAGCTRVHTVKSVDKFYFHSLALPNFAPRTVKVSPSVHKKIVQSILGTKQFDEFTPKVEPILPQKAKYRTLDADWEPSEKRT